MRISLESVRYLGLILLLLHAYSSAFGQDQSIDQESTEDTSSIYFSDYSHLLSLRIFTSTKWNTLDIHKDGLPLKLKPNSPTSLGVGFNYKSIGLALALGLPKSASSNAKRGNTKRLDIQASVYGKKFGFDGFTQIYRGYYNFNPEDFIEWNSDSFPILGDMKIVSFGINAFYLFNANKFSYKAAFVRTQIQLKSAGSFTLGVFGNVDLATTDNGFIPNELPDSLKMSFDLKSFNTIALGVSVGYQYTWVISQHFFLNVSLTPGFGYQQIGLETIDGATSTKHAPAAQLAGRSALGYDTKSFYMGLTGSAVLRNFQYKGYELDLATEQFKFFVGKRF